MFIGKETGERQKLSNDILDNKHLEEVSNVQWAIVNIDKFKKLKDEI